MTVTTLEALVKSLETAIVSKKYRSLQSSLKLARDSFSVKLEVAINGKMETLATEAQRLSTAIRNGTVETTKAVQNKRKPTAPKTTKIITDVEPAVVESKPKQVSADLQLAEAKATIAKLQQELADAMNEIAAQAEALEHARATVVNHANTIRDQKKTIAEQSATIVKLEELLITKDTTSVDEAIEDEDYSDIEETDDDEEETDDDEEETDDDDDCDCGDAADELALMIHSHGYDSITDVLRELKKSIKQTYGNYKVKAFVTAFEDMEFDTVQELADVIRSTFDEVGISLDLLESALVK